MDEPISKKKKNYYVLNPEKFKNCAKRYYEQGGGKDKKKQYYQENKQMLINRAKERYQAHREDILKSRKVKLAEKKLSVLIVEDNEQPTNIDAVTITTESTKSKSEKKDNGADIRFEPA
jgi:hypothetical protein